MYAAPEAVGTPTLPSPPVGAPLHDVRSWVREGRIRAALAALLAADPVPHHESPGLRGEVAALTVECLLAQGDTAAAVAEADQVADLVTGAGAALALHARAEVASAQERHEQALELYLAAGAAEAADDVPGTTPAGHVPWRCGAALALVRCGRRREAGEPALVEHALAVERGDVHDVARALRTLAATAADGRAIVRLEEARGLLGPDASRRLAAQIDTDLAAHLLLTGNAVRATTLLRDAELYAAREDLWPLLSRVRRLLERLGETPLRLEDEALAVLTHAERRVAVLALDGLTNRQIAEQLLVSVKAVEGHLSKVYRKLDVTSRGGLAATIGRIG